MATVSIPIPAAMIFENDYQKSADENAPQRSALAEDGRPEDRDISSR